MAADSLNRESETSQKQGAVYEGDEMLKRSVEEEGRREARVSLVDGDERV